MASKFYRNGLLKLISSIVATGTNFVDFGIDNPDPTSDPIKVSDTNYQSHTVSEFGFSTPSGSVAYRNGNTVYYFDKIAGQGAASPHKDAGALKWVLISNSTSVLFQIALTNSLSVNGPNGDVPGNQVKLGKYVFENNTMYRGIYIELSSAAQS